MYNHPSEYTSHILYICLFNVIDAFVSAHCSCALFLAYACVSDVRDVSVPCCFGCCEEVKSLHSDEVAALRELEQPKPCFTVWSSTNFVNEGALESRPARVVPGFAVKIGKLKMLGIACVVNLCAEDVA